MSEFIAKIKAVLDTSKAEQQLKDLENKQIKIGVEVEGQKEIPKVNQEIVNDNSVLVQVPPNKKGKKFKPFYMSPKFIFTEHEHAKRAGKDWEHHMRNRNKKKRESK